MKVTKLWDFDKELRNVLWRPQGSLYFFVSQFNFFFTILSACSISGSVGLSMLSCYHGVQGKDAFYLSILVMVGFKWNNRLYALGCKNSLTFLYTLQFGMEIVQ